MHELLVTKMPKRGHAKTTRHLRKVEEMKWVKELGINKIIYKTNRILRKWGVNCPITVITLSHPKVDFILEEAYFYALGIEGPYPYAIGIKRTDKYLAYISLQYQTIICPLGGFVYIFSLPSASWFIGYSKVGTSLIQHPPLNLPLPLVLAVKALVDRVTGLYREWIGFCDCWRHDPQNYIAVVILKSNEELSITILFGRRDAECKIDANGREIYHFVGGHSQVVAEALKIIALSSL
jgi:hypothetical protein